MTEENTTVSKHLKILLLFTVLIAYSYSFHGKAYDNALSRLDLTFSLALHGTLNIDAYHGNTIDKAYYEGHYYSDKAPGLSLAAVPAVAILKNVFPAVEWSPDNMYARFAITLLLVGIPSVFLAFLLINLTRNITGMDSLVTTFVYSLGSLALPYSVMFYSHQFCAVLLVAAFYIHYQNRSGASVPNFTNGALTGLLAGYAVVCEYPAAVPAALIAGSAFLSCGNIRHRAGLAAGVIIPLVILGAYNYAVFEHPLRIGYEYEVNQWFKAEMGKGIGGVGIPKPGVILHLLGAPQRGLFWAQPFLLLSIPGLYLLFSKDRKRRTAALISGGIILAAILINAGYYEPYGGFAPGPRFLVLSLPFWFLAAATCWAAGGTVTRAMAAGAGMLSVIYYSLITLVEPHVPHVFNAPLFNFTIPLVRAGWEPANIATVLGTPGLWSVVPLLLLISICTILILIYEFRGHDLFESAGGIMSGFLAVAVVFLITTYVSKPDPALNSYYIGTALNGNGRYEAAEGYLTYSVSLRPELAQARYAMGIAQI
ncbi:hypothetical protein ACFLQK_02815, partial [bacterium]